MAGLDRARLLAYVGVFARLFRFKALSRFGAVGRTEAGLHARMETLIERLSIALPPPRAAALADLVGFSEWARSTGSFGSPVSNRPWGRAEAALARADIGFTPMRTTTGHGFHLPAPNEAVGPSCSQPSCSSTRRSVEPTSTRALEADAGMTPP